MEVPQVRKEVKFCTSIVPAVDDQVLSRARSVLVYLDDIPALGLDPEGLFRNLQQEFNRCRYAGLDLHEAKCTGPFPA